MYSIIGLTIRVFSLKFEGKMNSTVPENNLTNHPHVILGLLLIGFGYVAILLGLFGLIYGYIDFSNNVLKVHIWFIAAVLMIFIGIAFLIRVRIYHRYSTIR